MDRLVFPLGMLVLTLVCIGLLLLPFALNTLETRRTPLRWLVVLLTGYLALSSVAGGLAYVLLPADYTKLHRYTLHPNANSLGEIHAVDLQLLAQPGAFAPSQVLARHAEIAAEREQFVREWARVVGYGLCGMLVGFACWQGSRGRTRRRASA